MRRIPILLAILAYVGFISLGLPDGLLGVAWPSIRASFRLPIDALGALLVMFTAGYLVSSFSSGRLLARMSVGALLALSCLATGIALASYALAPGWWLMVVAGFLAGLGAGAIDAGLNTYAATHFSARAVNWLHAFYGVGAATGPMIMASVLSSGQSWRSGYAIVAIGQLALAACFGLTRTSWSAASVTSNPVTKVSLPAASTVATLRLPIVWLSVAVFFVYTGLEAAAGVWVYSLLTEARAVPAMTAGAAVSIYWGCLTAGRLLSGWLVGTASVGRLMSFSIAGIALGSLLLCFKTTGSLSMFALALIGLSCAPVFPSLIAATPARLGATHTANGVGFQIAAAVLGQSLLPAFLGLLAGARGLEIVGPYLLVGALLLWALHQGLTAAEPLGSPAPALRCAS